MTLSEPHPTRPYEEVGVKLGDYQFERAARLGGEGPARARRHRGRAGRRRRLRPLRRRRALLRDRRGRHPRRREPRRRGLRLRADLLHLDDDRGVPEPARDLGEGARLVHDRAVLRARGLRLPGGDRAGRVRERRARGGAARARAGSTATASRSSTGSATSSSRCSRPCTSSGSTRRSRFAVKGVEVAPRDVVAAALPDPATLGERMTGKTCAGTLVTGLGKDGNPRKTYLYHVADNETSMREYGSQAVVWQTAINPVIALELLANGDWSGVGRPRARGLPAAAVPRQARRVRRAARRPRARRRSGASHPLDSRRPVHAAGVEGVHELLILVVLGSDSGTAPSRCTSGTSGARRCVSGRASRRMREPPTR